MSEEKGGFAAMIKRGLVTALAVLVGSYLINGITYEDSGALVLAVVLLGVMGAVLKPILVLLALPFVVLTLGIGVLFINALLYLLAGKLVAGFEVATFGAAFWGALIVTFFNVMFSGWINDGGYFQGSRRVRWSPGSPFSGRRKSGGEPRRENRPRKVKPKDDIIDI